MLTWIYDIDKQKYIDQPLFCKELAFRLNVSDALFSPERLLFSGMCFQTFCNHARFLAQYYHASSITIVKAERKDIVYFLREKWLPCSEKKENESIQDFYDIHFYKSYFINHGWILQPFTETELFTEKINLKVQM